MSIGKKHIVFHSYPVWSHNKTAVVLAVFVLESRPDLIFTVFTDSVVYAKFTQELFLRLHPSRYKAIASRLNVIDVSGKPAVPPTIFHDVDPALKALYSMQPVTCKSSGKTYDGLPRPILAIVDPFASSAIETIRKISKGPVIAWMSSSGGEVLSTLGPQHLGGATDPELETAAGLIKAKEGLATFAQRSVFSSEGRLHEVPGLPPMYDYEFTPQDIPIPPGSLERSGQIYLRDTDGVICVTSSAFEKETIDAAKKWYECMGKTFYTMGPLYLPNIRATEMNECEMEVVSFLDRMQTRFGKKSLLYISFGTLFWPLQPEKLWAILEELIETQTPFILSLASMFAHLPEERKMMISNSGIGLTCQWAPQELILSHPATGWFITHGGWNSMQEALLSRVPLILWPFVGDQPFNAARIALSHRAGFELIEVRTGGIARDPYRCKGGSEPTFTVEATREEVRSLLTRIQGDEGQQVRERYEVVCEGMALAWEDGCESKQSFEAFLEKYVD